MKRHIRLRGINGDTEGQVWKGEALLRAGRRGSLEIVLDDSSVSRHHAEIRATANGWRVRDLGSTNGTFLNGARLGAGDWPLRLHDIIRCGNITLVVDELCDGREETDSGLTADNMVVDATASKSWNEAIEDLVFDRDRCPRPGEQLLVLLRTSHYLGHVESEDELLHNILNDAVGALDAQRGAIALSEGQGELLKLRALATAYGQVGSRTGFSQNIANRSFARGESTLCQISEDPELAAALSIAEGTMASVICVLLRTPRRKLGVLHLDRGPLQQPFTRDDLHLADALAASVSAGIESASLLRRQRELFLNTITILAQAVELRDEYTGGHTVRVTEYAVLLGQHLDLPARDLDLLRTGTPLHDIGKIGIDDAILRKPDRLTAQEFEIMKSHTTKGAKILEQVPDLHSIIPIARSHHERWDGKGYPDGLAGEAIPRLARIVAIADAFDAMTSDRPYRAGMPSRDAFAEVAKQKGRQFDPRFAEAFLAIHQRIEQEMQTQTRKLTPSATLSATHGPARAAIV